MSDWVTYAQAAEILGCHCSNVAKLVEKGQLTSTGKRGASFDRSQVEALAQRRVAEREARANKRGTRNQWLDPRPDADHEWLSLAETAGFLGVTPRAVLARIHRERLPAVANRGHYWVRRDHLEQVEAARLARRTRQP